MTAGTARDLLYLTMGRNTIWISTSRPTFEGLDAGFEDRNDLGEARRFEEVPHLEAVICEPDPSTLPPRLLRRPTRGLQVADLWSSFAPP